MFAYKSTKTVTDKKLFLSLPEDFNNKEVEIIIFLKYPEKQQNNKTEKQKKQNLISLLDETPQWDDVQEQAFAEANKYLQSWEQK
ncbi:MAG: hypothetical protein DRJ05_16070 [Bacteroidetes bacterium]|nr:MAG: hypothetical protein DRJ05_16070 [Bacteroidota bacterium]